MVTVVDAANFPAELGTGDELAERGLAPFEDDEDDERTVSDLLVETVRGRVRATDVLGTGLWSQAVSVARFEPAGINEPGAPGQRAQELVFIGTDLEPAALHSALEECLLDGERNGGEDPFPAWDVPEAHEVCVHEQHGTVLPV